MQRYPWEQGFAAQALYEAGKDDLWIPMAHDSVKRQLADGRLAMVGGEAPVSDPAANGEVCLRAYEKTGAPLYLHGAERMLAYLDREAPRTSDDIIIMFLLTRITLRTSCGSTACSWSLLSSPVWGKLKTPQTR